MIELLTLALATFVSEDLACLSAGLLVASGRHSFAAATLACLLGIYAGDLLLFLLGRHAGAPVMQRLRARWPDAIERGSAFLGRHGASAIFAARFLPGTRLPTYLAAGALRMSVARFSLYFLLAAMVWTPLLVGSTAFLRDFGWPVRIAVALAMIAALQLVRILRDARARRLLYGRVSRWLRWEFWPSWLAYVPLVPYLLWLAIRHRSATCFTAANPAIPAGGVVGESKFAILRLLRRTPEFLPKTQLIDAPSPGEAAEHVSLFMTRAGLGFPIVLKPDAGQRGSGVVVARSADEVRAYFERFRGPVICQEHIEGPELGVFYVRHPNETRGRIISVTEKRLPRVIGDGVSTIETLILRDDRAVCMAPFYLRRLGARAKEIPAIHEPVRLVDLGTHCRGAVFLDGGPLLTPSLEEAIDRISRAAEGFYFGRYDIRGESLVDLMLGRFKVLELNGVTSEATHIYDPRLGVAAAYRMLFRQWRLAFEIGACNRRRGVETTSLSELLHRLRAYRQIALSHPE